MKVKPLPKRQEIRAWDIFNNNLTHVIYIQVLEATTTATSTPITTMTTTLPDGTSLMLIGIAAGAVVVILVIVMVIRKRPVQNKLRGPRAPHSYLLLMQKNM
jgi:hypothetical protein